MDKKKKTFQDEVTEWLKRDRGINEAEQFYRSLFEATMRTFENAEIKPISDEHCCKLAAWLYAYAEGNHEVVTNYVLNGHIRYAQKRLNMYSSEKPNAELFPMLQKYLKEADAYKRFPERFSKKYPDWAHEIVKYYGIKKLPEK